MMAPTEDIYYADFWHLYDDRLSIRHLAKEEYSQLLKKVEIENA